MENATGQVVRRRNYPDIPRVRSISEDLQYAREVLAGPASNADPGFRDRLLRAVERGEPVGQMLAERSVAFIGPVLQPWLEDGWRRQRNGTRFPDRLDWQQSGVRPSAEEVDGRGHFGAGWKRGSALGTRIRLKMALAWSAHGQSAGAAID